MDPRPPYGPPFPPGPGNTPGMTPRTQRRLLIGGGAFVVAALAVYGIGAATGLHPSAPATASPAARSAPAHPARTTRPAATDPAKKLAGLDGSTRTGDYQRALDRLGPRCTQPPGRLADLAWWGHQDLARHHINESGLEVAAHLADSVPATAGRVDCQGILAGYLVLREG